MEERTTERQISSNDLDLLERHRPLLRYDRQYDYRASSVSGAVENPGNVLRRGEGEVVARAGGEPPLSLDLLSDYPEGVAPRADDCIAMAPDVLGDARRMEGEGRYAGRLYGHVVRSEGRTWLQYWLWFYYNPKNLFGFGKHEGDWEMVQIGLDASGAPELAAYSQHAAGEARRFADGGVETVERDGGRHPVVYVASLSHACYFTPGTHVYSAIGIDHAYGDGPEELLPVEPAGRWAKWPGRWGSSEHVIANRLGNGPPGPGRQAKWDHPAAFQAGARRRAGLRLLGGALHWIGKGTYPRPPSIEARSEGRCCLIDYRLESTARRRSRHLYLTVHSGQRTIASRAVRRPPAEGREVLLLPDGAEPTSVCASAFNRLRQRSDVTEASL
ncbi:MAG TPA: hypothetical protein VGB06_03610 [Solirubrobacterales bacterium]|jgi:hypothetical protein